MSMASLRVVFAILGTGASLRKSSSRAQTCSSQWNNNACAGSECYTCGDRITYVMGTGVDNVDAENQIANEFPSECGGCGCGSAWGTSACSGSECYTCGQRVHYLVNSLNQNSDSARQSIASEFPSECGACSGGGGGPAPSPAPTPPGPPGSSIRVMSYNTEYTGYSDGRMGNFAGKIREVAPAIVGLQECQNRDGLAGQAGYTPLYGTGNQNYILYNSSKVSFVSDGWMRIPRDNYAERAITWGHFRLGNRNIYFFNTHLPHNHGEASDWQTHGWIANDLLQKRRELGIENEPTIVTGDMNSHASNFNQAPNGGFESTLVNNGFVWAYEVRGNPGYSRIDSILYSGAHWTHSDCGDTGTGSSDHSSIACTVTLK